MSFYYQKNSCTIVIIIKKGVEALDIMSAVGTLKKRNNKRIIEQHYIQKVLQEAADTIENRQSEIFGSRNIPDAIRSSRSFIVSNNKLTHKHNIRQRFDDMKQTRFGKQKPTKAHNKLIWGAYGNVVFQLAYGLTEDAKNQIVNEYNIEL